MGHARVGCSGDRDPAGLEAPGLASVPSLTVSPDAVHSYGRHPELCPRRTAHAAVTRERRGLLAAGGVPVLQRRPHSPAGVGAGAGGAASLGANHPLSPAPQDNAEGAVRGQSARGRVWEGEPCRRVGSPRPGACAAGGGPRPLASAGHLPSVALPRWALAPLSRALGPSPWGFATAPHLPAGRLSAGRPHIPSQPGSALRPLGLWHGASWSHRGPPELCPPHTGVLGEQGRAACRPLSAECFFPRKPQGSLAKIHSALKKKKKKKTIFGLFASSQQNRERWEEFPCSPPPKRMHSLPHVHAPSGRDSAESG